VTGVIPSPREEQKKRQENTRGGCRAPRTKTVRDEGRWAKVTLQGTGLLRSNKVVGRGGEAQGIRVGKGDTESRGKGRERKQDYRKL